MSHSDQLSSRASGRVRGVSPRASYRLPVLRAYSQAGLVNNVNDGLA
jgi:hypothetical protein